MTPSSPSTAHAPAVTVMVVSDYRPGEQKSWNDLRATLAALATQDFDEPVEHLLLENRADLAQMPKDVPATLPGVRVVASDARNSYELKNAPTSTGETPARSICSRRTT